MAEIQDPGEAYKNWKAGDPDPMTRGVASPQSELQQPQPETAQIVPGTTVKIGDPVSVIRSDNQVEHDWTLKAFGASTAVAEKPNPDKPGEMLRKPIPLEDFRNWQKDRPAQRYAELRGKGMLGPLDAEAKLRQAGLTDEKLQQIIGH